MQEVIRDQVDWVMDEREEGKSVPTPLIHRIPKGSSYTHFWGVSLIGQSFRDSHTQRAGSDAGALVLGSLLSPAITPNPLEWYVKVQWCRWSSLLTVADFNKMLEEFYDAFATTQSAEEWLEEHEFEDALSCEAEEWMAQ